MQYNLPQGVTLYHADCREALRSLPSDSIDSVPCDPPYELNFMGKGWDDTGIANDPALWAEVFRVLKPGGHLAAFSASRTYHRMACAIEDAGFEIRDSLLHVIDPADPIIAFMVSLSAEQLGAFLHCIDHSQFGGLLAWIYGTGFPKSQNVALAMDKKAGAVGHLAKSFNMKGGGDRSDEFTENGRDFSLRHEPVTEEARAWSGWGTALKPAFEPIVLARKPLSEPTVAANVLRWRTGALNIGACRVPTSQNDDIHAKNPHTVNKGSNEIYGAFKKDGACPAYDPGLGRWPANVVHDGSDEVVGMFPVTGGSKATAGVVRHGRSGGIMGKEGAIRDGRPEGHDDPGGSAARFFYSAKASKLDRNGSKHPTVKPIALMEWLAKLITPPGGTILDPFAGSGTTGIAATRCGFRAVLVEREAEYVRDIRARFGPASRLLPFPLDAVRRELALAPLVAALRVRLGQAAHV